VCARLLECHAADGEGLRYRFRDRKIAARCPGVSATRSNATRYQIIANYSMSSPLRPLRLTFDAERADERKLARPADRRWAASHLEDVIALAVVQHGVARHYPAGMLLEHYFDGLGRARDQLLLGSNELDPDVDPLCRAASIFLLSRGGSGTKTAGRCA
jgi:hypothetical protein